MTNAQYGRLQYLLILFVCVGFTVPGLDHGGGIAFGKTITVIDIFDKRNSLRKNLRQAIAEANQTQEADIIVIPAVGRGSRKIILERGELDISTNMEIRGPGAAKFSIDGDGRSRIFRIRRGVTVNINGLSLDNAKSGLGGAVLNEGDATLRNVLLQNNEGSSGGAIHNDRKATLKLNTVAFKKNQATIGGALTNRPQGDVTIDNVVFESNTATDQCGAILNEGGIKIEGSKLQLNEARKKDGGAICNFGNMTIDRSSINDNKAKRQGGGLYLESGTLTAVNSTLSGNRANLGAAVHGAQTSRFDLYHVTITANDAGPSAAVFLENSANGSLHNTLVVNQKRGRDCSSRLRSKPPKAGDFNIDSDGTCIGRRQQNGDRTEPDAKLKSRNKEGVHEPEVNSPAVEGGTPLSCKGPNNRVLRADQLGRRRVQNRACDVGAVEVKRIAVVVDDDFIGGDDRPEFGPIVGDRQIDQSTFGNSATMDVRRVSPALRGQDIQVGLTSKRPQRAASETIRCQLNQESPFACGEGAWTFEDLEPGMVHIFCVTTWEESSEVSEPLQTGEDCIIWDILTPEEGLDTLVKRLETLLALSELDNALGLILIDEAVSISTYLEQSEIDVVVSLLQDFQLFLEFLVEDAQLNPDAASWLTDLVSDLIRFLHPELELAGE